MTESDDSCSYFSLTWHYAQFVVILICELYNCWRALADSAWYIADKKIDTSAKSHLYELLKWWYKWENYQHFMFM